MIISEPFAIGKSLIHSLDPRIRVIYACLYSVITALLTQFSALLTAFALSLVLITLARLDFRQVARRLLVVLGFLLLIWIMLPFTFKGEVLYRIGPLEVTRPGIILSARITLKAVSILLTIMALVATMSIATLGHTLNRLRVPEKLVFLLLITYRYIFVIHEEYLKLRTAIKIRGFRPGTNLHSYKTSAYLIGMLFVRASMRAERVNQAMRCRGFKGRFYSLDEIDTYRSFWLFSILMAGIIGFLMVLEWIIR